MRKFGIAVICLVMGITGMFGVVSSSPVYAEETKEETALHISAPSAILVEASTGKVIFEKDADTKRPPASVTKIMTLLLIFDAIEEGKIKLDDVVTVSEDAASMGGSQVFLEPGETQTVETMMKCIAVASANDACVAMAEHICGSEEAFVEKMNKRAKGLGMENTHFVNCNGLDIDEHLTTARDISLMSRELINKYPKVHDYSMIWQENITHSTSKGDSEFGLTNTNKLVRHYQYATGLKTGSTGKAKFCVSATAKKEGVELVAVIMAADNSKQRFKDATTLLNFGFGKCNLYSDEKALYHGEVKVKRGIKKSVKVSQEKAFLYVDLEGNDLSRIKRKICLKSEYKAPIKKQDELGGIEYRLGKQVLGKTKIVSMENVKTMGYKEALLDVLAQFFF